MIGAISGYNPYSTYAAYGSYYTNRTQAQNTAPAQRSLVASAQKVHQPEAPVQPVTPARPISEEDPAQAGLLRFGSDPVEMAVRMRIQYPGDAAQAAGAKGEAAQAMNLPDAKSAEGNNSVLPADTQAPAVGGSKSAREVMEEGECQTCKERKYQDGSDDPGVSFKTPTNIDPDQAAAAVRGHENEHVVREQAKARQEDRKVVSQSVTYHTDICPECGKVYVSGGTTRTVTKASSSGQADSQDNRQDPSRAFAAI